MKPILADASAILAYLNYEPGGKIVEKHLHELQVTAVNVAEIITVLSLRGVTKEWIDSEVLQVFSNVIPLNVELAALTGTLAVLTRDYGLSLGDRACLAAGIVHNAHVLTTDSVWKKLKIDVEIEVIR